MLKSNKTYQSEESLVAALKAKERESYSYLYDNYCNALYGVIFRIVQTEELSNDILQDAFVKIWKNIDAGS